MAKELYIVATSGQNVYAIIYRKSDGYVADIAGSAFEAFDALSIADYDVALTASVSSDYYAGDFPTWIAAGEYRIAFYVRAGGAPATSDTILGEKTLVWSGTGLTSPTVGTNTVTLDNLRTELRIAARNAGEDDADEDFYSLAEKDSAIIAALNYFIDATKCTQKYDSVVTVAATAAVDFSGVAGLSPERIKKMWIAGEDEVRIADAREVDEKATTCPRSGPPTDIAFQDFNDLSNTVAYPTPDDDYTIKIHWTPPLVTFTAGDVGAGATVINVPGDLAREVIRTGGVYYLQCNQPKQNAEGVIVRLRAEFERFCLKKAGTPWLGVRGSRRNTLRDVRGL